MPETRNETIARLLRDIRHATLAQSDDPSGFLQALQGEIERMPGAWVAFSTRDASWLDSLGYLEGRGDLSAEAKQEALVDASCEYEDGYAASDAITTVMDGILDARHPATEESDDVSP